MASEDYTRDSARTYGRTWPRTVAEPSLFLNFTSATALDPRITFSRGSQATLFDSTGTLRYAKHNLFLQSQTFQTSWTATRSSVSTDNTIAPDGTLTADKLVEDTTATNTHNITQAVSFLAGFAHTYSIFVKAAERSAVRVLFPAAAFGSNLTANFDIATGAWRTTNPTPSSGLTLGVQNFGNGWYRITATATATTAASSTILLLLLDSPSSTGSYTGDGTSGVYIWGAQLNLANMEGGVTSSLTTYYPTTTAAYYAPRFDYNPSTLQPRGLLIEEQRTNSIRNNTMQGAVAGTPGTLPTNWAWSATTAGLTVEVIGTGVESGITYIDLKMSGTADGTAFTLGFEPSSIVTASSGQTWTLSTYSRIVGGSLSNIVYNLSITEQNGASVLTSGAVAVTPTTDPLNSQRFSFTRTLTNASTNNIRPRPRFDTTAGAVDLTLRIGLPQLELGAFATSVIPTTTTALTRNADVATMTGTNFSDWFNPAEGTLFVEASTAAAADTYIFADINSGVTTNYIRQSTSSAGTFNQFVLQVTGSIVAAPGVTVTLGSSRKMAGAYILNSVQQAVNGTLGIEDTNAAIPAGMSQMNLGSRAGSVNDSQIWIARIAYYPTRLPNTTLQALTA